MSEDDPSPSARLCLLAARAEDMLDNPRDARLWLERAATAPLEADWSDLDPSGEAFHYTAQDWRRLIMSYGEAGELIHPRQEQLSPRRAILPALSPDLAPTQTDEGPDTVTGSRDGASLDDDKERGETSPTEDKEDIAPLLTRQPDDPGNGTYDSVLDVSEDDLAERLDNLLESDLGANKRP